MRAGAVAEPRTRFRPWHEALATIGALSELGAVLDPLRPTATLRGRAAGVQGRVETAETPAPPHPRRAPARPGRAGDGSTEVRGTEATIPTAGATARPGQTAADAGHDGEGATVGRVSELLRSLRRPVNIAFVVVLVAVVSVWWVALRPTSWFGGSATFITVKGTSMLPTLKTGDFVLAEAQPSYKIGDLVVYRVPRGQIGAGDDLIHRIVAGNATTGFTLKGDNNPAPDPWIVPRSDVLGKEALAIPGLGNSLLVIRSPLFAGLAAALIAMWLVISPPGWMRRRKPASAAAEATPPTPAATTPPARGRSRTSAKPVAPAASPATRPRPARRTRAPRREP
jgi:signal peptidase